MAVTEKNITSTGATSYTFEFEYLKTTDVKISVNGTATTEFIVPTGAPTTVQFNTGHVPASGAAIRIYRDTDVDNLSASFYAGSAIKSQDLNDNFSQNLYVTQEAKRDVASAWQTGDETIDSTETWAGNNTRVATTGAIDGRVDSKIDTALSSDVLAGQSITKTTANGQVTISIANGAIGADQIDADAVGASELADNSVSSANIINGSIVEGDLATGALDGRYYTETELNAGQLDNRYYTETELNAGQLDNRYYTETESDARYFNISTGDTIKDGDTFPDNDTTIATTAAINDRIIDLVDDVGGFVPIANETSFPNANPDVNNGAGTLVSIKALSSDLTSNGSGVATIANGTVGNSTVTITGLANSTTYASTFGMIVETTSTLNTYAFHRQVPKATEVTTVASSISNINSVAGNISNITTVAGNNSNINTVAAANSNITTVAGNNTNITTVAGNNTNINTVAGANSNISTVATNIANVNNVGGAIANVNTVATNISGVNDFAARYRIASSAPGSNNDEGDLYFDTTSNELRVYNGSAWQGGVTATGNLAGLGANTFTGAQTFVAGQTFDGRDVSADGSKLDGIETAATADQTNAEIRAAVEAAGDSNVFTDADHTKLNGIEASATADQTKSDIDSLNINADQLDGQHGAYYQDASNLNAGTIPDARFPATLPAASGANLTSLPAGNLTGTVADARISTLTASKLTGALPSISGANLTNLPASGGEITGTASGALTNARAVKVNTNGTFSQAALAPPSWGNSHTPISGQNFTSYTKTCYVEDNKFLVCWYDTSAVSAKAVVCQVNANGTVTWGTPVVPQTYSNAVNQVAWDKDNNIGIYNTIGNSNGFFGIQFTISGLTPTFGTGLSYPIGSSSDSWNGKLIYGKAGKFGFWYVMYSQLRWFRWASNPSNVNTAPSVLNGGSQSTSSSASTRIAGCWNSVNEKFCVFYHANSGYFYSQLFNSGASSSITSSGSQYLVTAHMGSSHYYGNLQVVYDNVNEKYLFGWADSSWRQYLRAATNTGSSWSFGTQITVTDSSDSNESTMWQYNHTPWMTWNSTSEEFTVMWGVSGKLKFKDPTISGTTITRGDTYEVSVTLTTSSDRAFLWTSEDSSRWLLLYGETNSLTKGLTRQGTSTSISNDNYVGFSDGTFSNGQTATIQLPGTVVDGLSGLTTGSKYYVSGDGTVSLADTYYTNLVAGVALSSSTLLLK